MPVQALLGVTVTLDDNAKPMREIIQFIPTRPTQLAHNRAVYDNYPSSTNLAFQIVRIVKRKQIQSLTSH